MGQGSGGKEKRLISELVVVSLNNTGEQPLPSFFYTKPHTQGTAFLSVFVRDSA